MTLPVLQPVPANTTPIIMHIEHTGGSTLRYVIARQYAERDIYLMYTYSTKPAARYIQMTEAERRRYRLLLGHLSYGIHRHVPGGGRYVTILRHPVDRILSSYAYMARKSNRKHRDLYENAAVSWQAHFDNRGDHYRQMGRITGGSDESLDERRTNLSGSLESAIQHLETDFAMVGLQDRYDESLLMMRYVLNWRNPVVYTRQNTSHNRLQLKDLPAADRALIEKMAETEMPLYEYAQKRFAAQIEAYPGDFARDLAQFRADNARYAQSQARIERLKAPVRALRRTLSKILKRESTD